jgi:CheY-like chemotaxis protein
LRMPSRRTPEYVERGLEVIERNTRLQTQLISDLLDVSRIISGKLWIEPEPVELPVVIEAALDAHRAAARAKSIELDASIEPLDVPVQGDAARIQQIVVNLLSNAIKFTPSGGRVQVSLVRRGRRAVLTVRDTGKGIRPEFLPHVFERFRQADGSITRSHGGLGLGLSIVRHLVERHGGTVRAESEGVGKGALFTVELPLGGVSARGDAWSSAAVPNVSLHDPGSLRGVRVLIVDDEPDARELVRRVLEERDAAVCAAASAAEALQAMSADVPDVLVCDIGMPDMDGYALLRAIRAGERGRAVPAVALTAFARPEDRERAFAAGFQMHLSKPFEPAELIAMVGRLATS